MATLKNEGICRLCQKYGPLMSSHYIPKSLYKLMREKHDCAEDPIHLTRHSAKQTSSQVISPLLCANCEELFNKHGENWVLGRCFREAGKFKIQEAFKNHASNNDDVFYAARNMPEVMVEKLVYFAASIFWRASVHTWASGTDPLKGIQLGSKYEEEFRQFLLGMREFPQDAMLKIIVSTNTPPLKCVVAPYGQQRGTFDSSCFYIPGIQFVLSVGGLIPESVRASCIVHTHEQRIYWQDTNLYIWDLGLSQAESALPIGKLAEAYPGHPKLLSSTEN